MLPMPVSSPVIMEVAMWLISTLIQVLIMGDRNCQDYSAFISSEEPTYQAIFHINVILMRGGLTRKTSKRYSTYIYFWKHLINTVLNTCNNTSYIIMAFRSRKTIG